MNGFASRRRVARAFRLVGLTGELAPHLRMVGAAVARAYALAWNGEGR